MVNRLGHDRAFTSVNYVFLTLVALVTLLPFVNVLAKSVSENSAVMAGRVGLVPSGFQLTTYRYVLLESGFLRSLRVSLFVTIAGTFGGLVMSAITAYPLSKTWLRGRKLFLSIYVFSMIFAPGLVPRYLLMRYLGLLNTIWVLIIPYTLAIYNMILMKNYFEGLPESLEESARIDGASNLRILFSIVLPISKPIMATITIFYAVSFWNNYFSAMIFVTKPELKPLQLFLLELIRQMEDPLTSGDDAAMTMPPETVRSASIILTTLPIIVVYPFLQRHFVKGIVIGSVKG
jgi:putative aldouronate transport system permease protein